jgi:hypothetical protein
MGNLILIVIFYLFFQLISTLCPVAMALYLASRITRSCRPISPGTGEGRLFFTVCAKSSICMACCFTSGALLQE